MSSPTRERTQHAVPEATAVVASRPTQEGAETSPNKHARRRAQKQAKEAAKVAGEMVCVQKVLHTPDFGIGSRNSEFGNSMQFESGLRNTVLRWKVALNEVSYSVDR